MKWLQRCRGDGEEVQSGQDGLVSDLHGAVREANSLQNPRLFLTQSLAQARKNHSSHSQSNPSLRPRIEF